MDLKPYYDAAVAADAEVKRVAQEIDTHFTAGEQEAALALRPALDEAKTKAVAANELYLSMRKADEGTDVSPLFVPANPDATQSLSATAKQKTRPEFEALDARERMTFIQNGGQIISKVEE